MLKRTIVYTNSFTNEKVSEEHYFHISKAQLIDLQMENQREPEVLDAQGNKLEGWPAKLQRIINDEDGSAIVAEIKDLIERSYCKREGDRPLRSPEIFAEFEGSEAYSQLYWELCMNAQAQSEFINAVFPNELQDEVNKIVAAQTSDTEPAIAMEQVVAPTEPADENEPRVLTQTEVIEMDRDELKSGLATGRYKLS